MVSCFRVLRRRKCMIIIKGLLLVIISWLAVVSIRNITQDRDSNLTQEQLAGLSVRPIEQHPHVLKQVGADGGGIIEAPVQPISDVIITDGPGEMGKPVVLDNLTSEEELKRAQLFKSHAFNQYVSDMIALNRSLPDHRDDSCLKVDYPIEEMPQTSIIICFHNEAWSTLLRTVHSVINKSPGRLIKEILLVDDFSNFDHLQEPLERYVSRHFEKVKIIRAKERLGLIKARLFGISVAIGSVLTFLDSHCECNEGWLEPLLYRVHQNRTNVVSPFIDMINDETFEYIPTSTLRLGGFSWDLQFKWNEVPERIKKVRNESTAAVETPTIAGGLFSIDKQFFERIGTYDDGFQVWGAENLELSFKVWMCGGRLEIIPCSRVGHIFRNTSPYSWPGTENYILKRNPTRLAKVWMDDFAQYYFEKRETFTIDYGDITDRIKLRNDLKCHSFSWYLDNVCPEMFRPDKAVARGEIRNIGTKYKSQCLDASKGYSKPVEIDQCHEGERKQFWYMTANGEIRQNELCLEYAKHVVVTYKCHGKFKNQHWSYNPVRNQIWHLGSDLCMELTKDKTNVTLAICSDEPRQKWMFENYSKQNAIDAAVIDQKNDL